MEDDPEDKVSIESLNAQKVDPPKNLDDCFKNKRQRKFHDSGESSGSDQWSTGDLVIMSQGGQEERKDSSHEGSNNNNNSSHGSISVIGRRRVMKDAVAVTKLDSYQFFAVYDGHGGSSVSNACRDRLHHLVAEEAAPWIRGGGAGLDWENLLASCFAKMDNEVGASDVEGWVNTVGTSAVVAVVGRNEIVVANSGNSRAVLCSDGVAIPLSRDHLPDLPDEKRRVEAAGGRVIDWKGMRSRVLGVLSTSRSIGDHYLKPYVISEPEVTISQRTESCDFLVIASDGLWDVVSNEFACQVVGRCLEASQIKRRSSDGVSGCPAANAAALLAQLALARGSKDNITVIVVELKNPPRQCQ